METWIEAQRGKEEQKVEEEEVLDEEEKEQEGGGGGGGEKKTRGGKRLNKHPAKPSLSHFLLSSGGFPCQI